MGLKLALAFRRSPSLWAIGERTCIIDGFVRAQAPLTQVPSFGFRLATVGTAILLTIPLEA